MAAVGSALQEEMALKLVRLTDAMLFPSVLVREFRFDEQRKWRIDFFFPREMLGIEVDGGAFRGRHAGGKYLRASHERQNAITLAGIRLLRFTKDMIRDGTAIETVRRALGGVSG